MNRTLITTLPALAIGLAFSTQSHAAEEFMQNTTGATGTCQGALPVFEANLRKRPLGINNEGTGAAFVSCAFSTTRDQLDDVLGNRIVSYFGAFFTNNNSADTQVSCVGIRGLAGEPDNVFESQSVTVLANGVPGTADTGYIFFGPAQGDPLDYQNVSMSCNLPAGVSINDTYVGYKLNDADGQ